MVNDASRKVNRKRRGKGDYKHSEWVKTFASLQYRYQTMGFNSRMGIGISLKEMMING